MRIFIIEDDLIMAECIARAVASCQLKDAKDVVKSTTRTTRNVVKSTTPALLSTPQISIFPDAIAAMDAISEGCPDLILLDVLLGGPNGFTLLNELASYSDTAQIPVILITSLDLSREHLSHYHIVSILDKSTMTPAIIQEAICYAL